MSAFSYILGFLTLPGAVFRAFFEHVLLKICRVPVEDTDYLQHNELFGHVEHKPVHSFARGFSAAFFPGLPAFLCGVCTAGTAAVQLFYLQVRPISVITGSVSIAFIVSCVLWYAGLCLLCHVFPSYEDTLYLWEAWHGAKILPRILLCPAVVCMRAGAFLARFGVWQLLAAAATVILFICF